MEWSAVTSIYKVSTDDRLTLASTFLMLFAISQLLISARNLALYVGLAIFAYGIYVTWKSRNSFGAAHLYAAFFSAAEVYFRMTKAGVPVEFGKELAAAMLIFGMLVERRRFQTFFLLFFLYFILLIPGMYPTFQAYDFSFARYLVTYDLSGPLLIVIAGCYFYKRRFSDEEFIVLSRFFLFGVILMSLHILFKVGDYTAISYNISSNAGASGGFAGTQVSPVFGAGILVILINLVQNRTILHYKWLDILLLCIFLIQGFFTFSRGGLLSAFLAFVVGFILTYGLSPRKILFAGIIPGILLTISFGVVNDITGGKIYARYFNVDEQGYAVKEDYTTGRGNIIESDLKTFQEYPLTGVGIGLSADERLKNMGIKISSHNEYSRALSDHGILGLFSLVVLLLISGMRFFELRDRKTRFVFIVLISFALLMMVHGALRTSIYSYFFGLAFIIMQQVGSRQVLKKGTPRAL
jgi:hypothetical protein